MTRSKRLSDCFRKRRSLQRATERVRAKGGRSELHSEKPKGIGSASLTQTGTSIPKCSKDYWPLRMTLMSLLGVKGYAELITDENGLPFSPEFTYAFFSELDAIRRRGLKYSEGKLSHNGPRTGFCLMSKSSQKRKGTDTRSSKSQSNVKLKNKCRGERCGKPA